MARKDDVQDVAIASFQQVNQSPVPAGTSRAFFPNIPLSRKLLRNLANRSVPRPRCCRLLFFPRCQRRLG